ncbi:dihydroorotate dehydrogenase [Cypionkella psychrotolerans]|uniref:dihydroorotate dehydrogenase n=1 Tax=Cypionkella psychrotolerans TaxID=1678131 RepID=UPI0012E0DC85|nr:dihydroorotate dehydrogenase [Cypionkella psychrotolerans]
MDDLDDLFAGASRALVPPSDALMARVMADAAALQVRPVVAVVPRAGWLAGLAALFGGAGSLVGVGSAAVAGLFFGFVQPEGMGAVAEMWAGSAVDQVDLMPQLDVLLAEE